MEIQSTNLRLQSGQYFSKNVDEPQKSIDNFKYVSAERQYGDINSLNTDYHLRSHAIKEQAIESENIPLSHDVLQQRLVSVDARHTGNVSRKFGMAVPKIIKSDDTLSVIDLTVGENENLGNDMVLLKFNDGSLRQTQKALFEVADKLKVFEKVKTSSDFANWHTNDWSLGVTNDPILVSAHLEFNSTQAKYDKDLRSLNPSTAQNRKDFVLENAGSNSAALKAVESEMATEILPEEINLNLGLYALNDGDKMTVPVSMGQDIAELTELKIFSNGSRLYEQNVVADSELHALEIVTNIASIVNVSAKFETFDEHVSLTDDD